VRSDTQSGRAGSVLLQPPVKREGGLARHCPLINHRIMPGCRQGCGPTPDEEQPNKMTRQSELIGPPYRGIPCPATAEPSRKSRRSRHSHPRSIGAGAASARRCSRTWFVVGSTPRCAARGWRLREQPLKYPPRHSDHAVVLADLDPELDGLPVYSAIQRGTILTSSML
jgi:hypothetical protein